MKTLKKNWKNHEFSRCYLFFGEETYLIREYEAALRKAILPDAAEMMNEDSFKEKRATAAAIMDAAETLPFLNDKRLVIVRNSAFFQKGGRKEEGEKLKAFLSNLPETVCLLFIEEKVEKNNALYKRRLLHTDRRLPTQNHRLRWPCLFVPEQSNISPVPSNRKG